MASFYLIIFFFMKRYQVYSFKVFLSILKYHPWGSSFGLSPSKDQAAPFKCTIWYRRSAVCSASRVEWNWHSANGDAPSVLPLEGCPLPLETDQRDFTENRYWTNISNWNDKSCMTRWLTWGNWNVSQKNTHCKVCYYNRVQFVCLLHY